MDRDKIKLLEGHLSDRDMATINAELDRLQGQVVDALHERDELQCWLDKICSPISSWNRYQFDTYIDNLKEGSWKYAAYVIKHVRDYLDSKQEKPQPVSEYRDGKELSHCASNQIHAGSLKDCPVCTPKLQLCQECYGSGLSGIVQTFGLEPLSYFFCIACSGQGVITKGEKC
jgi:hypothetical protein